MKIDAFWRVLDDGFLFVVNQLLHLVMYAGFYNAFEPIYRVLYIIGWYIVLYCSFVGGKNAYH